MSDQVNHHLNEAQLLRALIDKKDMAAAEMAHLERCRPCRKKIEQMEEADFFVSSKVLK